MELNCSLSEGKAYEKQTEAVTPTNNEVLDGKSVNWRAKKEALRSTPDTSDATREGTSGEQSTRVHNNIDALKKKSSSFFTETTDY